MVCSRSLVLLAILSLPALARPSQDAPKPVLKGTGKAILFPDGRTVVVLIGGATRRFHLTGVEPFDPKASPGFLKGLISNQAVRVEADADLPTDPTDGIPLAYIYRESDGLLVNAEAVAQGEAKADDRWPHMLRDRILAAQEKAMAAKLGGWAEAPVVVVRPARVVAPAPSPPVMVKDPSYTPSPGDRVILLDSAGKKEDAYATSNMFSYDAMIKALRAKDSKGIEDLLKSRQMVLVPSETPVLVIEYHDNEFIGGGVPACEVRILGGDYEGQAVWCMAAEVARLIDRNELLRRSAPRRTGAIRRR